MSTTFTEVMLLILIVSSSTPIVPIILDRVNTLNEPRPRYHLSHTELNEKYKYAHVYLFYNLVLFSFIIIVQRIYCTIIIMAVHFLTLTETAG